MSKQKDGLSPPYFILTKPNENDHLQRKVRGTFVLFHNSPFTANVYIKVTEHHERKKFMTRKLNRIREGTRSNWMISECLDSNNMTRDWKLQKNNEAVRELLSFRRGMQNRTSLWRWLLKNSFVYAPYLLLIRFEGEGNKK